MARILTVARKELTIYRRSATALVFMGAFLALTLFVFFWVDAFWARGLADVRPLFDRLPLMLIVLVSALTMRQWSEEQRSGSQEILLTLPVRRVELVLGKLLAVVALVALTLALTVFLPVSVSLLGNLDWGPVVGGYLAALLLASAYGAIGLFISSRTDNQIVAFILSALGCGLLYAVGTTSTSALAGDTLGAVLRALGAGSRFASIQRGVIDLRDLVYYLTLTGIFVVANVLSLQAKGWAQGAQYRTLRQRAYAVASLLIANLLVLNVWLAPLRGLRWDLTAQQEFTLSPTTKTLLAQLPEPLEIRAYVSAKTHPLLAPLAPQLADMLREYQVAGGGRVRVSVVDPASDPEQEAEANRTYGIQPTPFQVAGRYETSIINSYFDVMLRYGDQTATLGFADLVEVNARRDGSLDVSFRNLEYDLTSAIKRVVYGFQSVEAVLAALPEPAQLTLYVTPDTLPEWLVAAPETIAQVAAEMAASGGNLVYRKVDLNDPASGMTPQQFAEQFGLQPLRASLLSAEGYYLDLILQVGETEQPVYPGATYSEAEVRTALEAALKRSTPGFLKVVGLWTPPPDPQNAQAAQLNSYYGVAEALSAEYQVRYVDLSGGAVPADLDVLLLIAPQNLTELERFAVDQYLMRGGAVIVAAGNYGLALDQMQGGLALRLLESGVRDLLLAYGVDVAPTLVLDPQNEPFPVTVNRTVGGYTVREMQAMNYPFFVDIRAEGMAESQPIVAGLQAVTLNWPSPIYVDETAQTGREVETLLHSSAGAWVQSDTNINPNLDLYPELGFAVVAPQQEQTLAVAVSGQFRSAYRQQGVPANAEGVVPDLALLSASPATARLVVFGSAEFLNDTVFSISARLAADRHLNSLQLVQNAVAWCVEDLDLLQIRARGTSTRVLLPVTERGQTWWEGLNYVAALAALLALALIWRSQARREAPMLLARPAEQAANDSTPNGGAQ